MEFKRKNDEVAQRLKRIERSLMTDKLKAAATKALSKAGLAKAGLKAGETKKSRRNIMQTAYQPASAWLPGKSEDKVPDSETDEGDSKPAQSMAVVSLLSKPPGQNSE